MERGCPAGESKDRSLGGQFVDFSRRAIAQSSRADHDSYSVHIFSGAFLAVSEPEPDGFQFGSFSVRSYRPAVFINIRATTTQRGGHFAPPALP